MSRLVIFDDHDNPIAFALEIDPGVIVVETLQESGQARFNEAMRQLGIDRTVVAKEYIVRRDPDDLRG